MSARLSTAISIAQAAKAILKKTQTFPTKGFGDHADVDDYEHIGVEPMLLALSMELALKAWFVFDWNDPNIAGHDLIKLFERLKPESQAKLDEEFKRSVAPYHPSFFHVDYGIRHILDQHKNAFIDWRYLHEKKKKTMSFDQAAFEATLEMVLREFQKRYRIVKMPTF
jgi:hypothetical protein